MHVLKQKNALNTVITKHPVIAILNLNLWDSPHIRRFDRVVLWINQSEQLLQMVDAGHPHSYQEEEVLYGFDGGSTSQSGPV